MYDEDANNIPSNKPARLNSNQTHGIKTRLFFCSNMVQLVFINKLISRSTWNSVPHYHVLLPGRLAPCLAHDLMSGFVKRDISDILLSMSLSSPMSWKFYQEGLYDLKRLLSHEDRRDLSTKLAGIEI